MLLLFFRFIDVLFCIYPITLLLYVPVSSAKQLSSMELNGIRVISASKLETLRTQLRNFVSELEGKAVKLLSGTNYPKPLNLSSPEQVLYVAVGCCLTSCGQGYGHVIAARSFLSLAHVLSLSFLGVCFLVLPLYISGGSRSVHSAKSRINKANVVCSNEQQDQGGETSVHKRRRLNVYSGAACSCPNHSCTPPRLQSAAHFCRRDQGTILYIVLIEMK